MNWQPIETAPKDGTHVLLWFDNEFKHQLCVFISGKWETLDGTSDFFAEPTHWMPLPEPPK